MLNDLFPPSYGRDYHGQPLALWLLGLLALIKLAMGLNCVFNGEFVARTADGLPLDQYGPAGMQAFLALFACWGLALAVLALLALLALLRYRAMVPLAFLLLLVEQAGRKLIFVESPLVRSAESNGGLINAVLLGALLAGLALSLWRRPGAAPAPAA